MNNLERFLALVMNLQPEQAYMLSRLLTLLSFAIIACLFVVSVVSAISALPFALDRQSDRIRDLELKYIDLKCDLSKERIGRESLERKIKDLEREHAQKLRELRSDVEELVQAMHEKRKPSISHRSEYRPLFYLRN